MTAFKRFDVKAEIECKKGKKQGPATLAIFANHCNQRSGSSESSRGYISPVSKNTTALRDALRSVAACYYEWQMSNVLSEDDRTRMAVLDQNLEIQLLVSDSRADSEQAILVWKERTLLLFMEAHRTRSSFEK